jgi:hypothetical protein
MHHHAQLSLLRWGLVNFLPELVLDHNPPDLSLPGSLDYRCEPPVPSSVVLSNEMLEHSHMLLVTGSALQEQRSVLCDMQSQKYLPSANPILTLKRTLS